MPVFKPRKCEVEDCKKEYKPLGPAARFCPECAVRLKRERIRTRMQTHRIRTGKTKKPGVGKGGNNSKGEEDSQYKNGIGYFMTSRGKFKELRGNACERCKVSLVEATKYEWVIHHRDHDRSNNRDENFELLCKRCHQLEHDCTSALPNKKV